MILFKPIINLIQLIINQVRIIHNIKNIRMYHKIIIHQLRLLLPQINRYLLSIFHQYLHEIQLNEKFNRAK